MTPEARPPVPIFRSFDEVKMREFYIDFLGFSVIFEHRFAPDAPLYVSLRMGACELHVSEHHGDATPGGAARIAVPDVHAYAKALNAKRYKHAGPGVQRQPYGWDDMSIADPFGNRLIFCTPNDQG